MLMFLRMKVFLSRSGDGGMLCVSAMDINIGDLLMEEIMKGWYCMWVVRSRARAI